MDASAVEGKTSLVGNANDNTIIAGKSDASLWSGFSSIDDLLIGVTLAILFSTSMVTDTIHIQGINDGDSVILPDISLDQITGTNITAESASIRFNDGDSLQMDSLQMQGTSDVTYQLADGSKYSANHQRLEWNSR